MIATGLVITSVWGGCTPVVRELEGGGGQGSSSSGGTGGGATACKPGDMVDCYSGPNGTANVGQCKSGKALCGDDGTPGACAGEVVPSPTPDCKAHQDQDCDGNVDRCPLEPIWAKTYAYQSITGLSFPGAAVDAQGNIALAGYFVNQLDFGNALLTSTDNGDCYVAKVGPDGTTAWAKQFGDATDDQYARDVRFDAQGNMIVVGSYYGTLANLGIVVPPSAGSSDAFVVKFNPMGTALWARWGGNASSQSAETLAVAPDGSVLVAGTTQSSFNFNGGGPVLASPIDSAKVVFVQRFDADGNPQWGQVLGGDLAAPPYEDTYGIKVDVNGDVLVSGYFSGTISFPGIGSYPSSGGDDIFVAKLAGSDGHVIWARTYGSSGGDEGYGLATDSKGNVFVSGRFDTSLQVENTTLVPQFSNTVGAFVIKLDTDGALVWAKSYGCGVQACGMFIDVGENDTVLLGGAVDGDIDFGGGVLSPGFAQGDASAAGVVAKLDTDGNYIASRVFQPVPNGGATQFGALVLNYRIMATPGTHEIVSAGTIFGESNFGLGKVGETAAGGPFLLKLAP
ncbi:Hypothetical protein A7982_08621 [Minicystis rosea]|nr:Hypothetical protein A7982_08621 [Minicystis rosea]